MAPPVFEPATYRSRNQHANQSASAPHLNVTWNKLEDDTNCRFQLIHQISQSIPSKLITNKYTMDTRDTGEQNQTIDGLA